MPALNTLASAHADAVGSSAPGALTSFLLAAVLRAKRLAFRTESAPANADAIFPQDSRIPASRIQELPTTTERKRERRSAKRTKMSSGLLVEKSDLDEDAVPEPMTDSVPLVHDRLPDPKLWEKLQLGAEVDSPAVVDYLPENEGSGGGGEGSLFNPSEFVRKQAKHTLSKRNISAGFEGMLRRRQLYCRNGYHLQILPTGRVTGTLKDHSRYGILEFVSVGVGVVTIRGVETGRYLAMDGRGQLYGSDVLNENCLFEETLEENKYNTYASLKHRHHSKARPCFVAISQHGRARPGCRSKKSQKFTHFLPTGVNPRKVPRHYEGEIY